FLIIAHAAVDEDRVAGDVVERAFDRNMAAALADHHGELALVIEMVGELGADHLALVADQRVGETDEHARLLGQLAAHFGGVRLVVHAGAEDFLGLRDHRQEADLRQLVVRLRPRSRRQDLVQRTRGQCLAQRAVRLHCHYAVASDHAEALLAVCEIACEFHRPTPYNCMSRSVGRHFRARRSSTLTIPLMISTSATATTMPANTPVVSESCRARSMEKPTPSVATRNSPTMAALTARGSATFNPVKKYGSSETQITSRAIIRSLAPIMRAMLTSR